MDSSVDTAISQLAALQSVDRQLREKTQLMQSLNADISALESQLMVQRETTRSVLTERDALETHRRQREAQLEDDEAKMKERRMRLNRVRNEKELQALRREIEVGKEANQQMEEEILQLLESLDTLAAQTTEAERLQAELEATATAQLEERRVRITQLAAELAEGRATRSRMTEALEVSILRKYEQIFERRGGTAVVEVRNSTCLGCHMNLPPQFFNELQRARDIRLCPNCHRILYCRPEPVDSVDPRR